MATLELPRLKPVDFSPRRPGAWADVEELCIGTLSEKLSDALVLSAIPTHLKEKYPRLRIHAYGRKFNTPVFRGNPSVEGFKRLPRSVLRDPIRDQNLKPEIFITEEEKSNSLKMIRDRLIPSNQGKPLCIVHAWKSDGTGVRSVEFWDGIIAQWNHQFRFWQVGLENDSAIQGCEYYFLQKRKTSGVRDLFALMSQATAFIGIQGAPMYIARAFSIPSWTLPKQDETPQHLDSSAFNEFFSNLSSFRRDLSPTRN